MPEQPPVFFFAAMSPYSWLAAERIGGLLPEARWEPVFAGGLFRAAGRKSWGLDERREEKIRECERRAREHGLGPIAWPAAMAHERRPRGPRDDLRQQPRPAPRLRAGGDAGRLPRGRRPRTPGGAAARSAPARTSPRPSSRPPSRTPPSRQQLRAATDGAHELGVIGVPTVAVGEQLFWGDDRLEEAARAAGGGPRRRRRSPLGPGTRALAGRRHERDRDPARRLVAGPPRRHDEARGHARALGRPRAAPTSRSCSRSPPLPRSARP